MLHRVVLVAIAAALVMGPAPASATWWGEMHRQTDKAGDTRLVAEFVSDRPTAGLHVGLRGTYTVTNVETGSNTPGPLGYPACTPTSRSDVTTHNAGVDCTFGNKTQHAIVWFETSPRVPDGQGAQDYDDETQQSHSVTGPLSAADAERIRPFLKKMALRSASSNLWAPICEQIGKLGVYADINDCYDEYNEQYDKLDVARDPPDSAGDEVWLPIGRKSPPPPACPSSGSAKERRACAATRKLVHAIDQAVVRYAAVWDAMGTTVNRLTGAEKAEESIYVGIQNAALVADGAELFDARDALAAARAKLAKKLTSLGVSPQLGAKAVAAGDRLLRAGKLPDYAMTGFNANGITADMIKANFGRLPAVRRGPVKLIALLRQPDLPAGPAATVAAKLRKTTFADLRMLALGLLGNKTITEDLYGKLANDAIAENARQYAADAAQAGGEAAKLLQAAVGAVGR